MKGKNPRQIAANVLGQALGVRQSRPLTPALSLSEGERAKLACDPALPGHPARSPAPPLPLQGGEGRGEGAGGFVEDMLEAELARAALPGPDRGLCQELVYGVMRWQTALDWLMNRKLKGRSPSPAAQNLLRLGLYQIFWLDRIAHHAAVHETVELAKQSGLNAQAGFINAMLRGYLRELDQSKALLSELKTSDPHLGYSHPAWLVTRWLQRWGRAKTIQLLEWDNTPPPVLARVNTLKTDTGRLSTRWDEEGVQSLPFVRDWLEPDLVFQLEKYPPLETLGSFQDGWFYVQDPSTLLAVQELAPQPGQTILDLCAAPGGKLTYIAQRMRNQGRILACDSSAARLQLLRQNCARLGVTCALEAVASSKLQVASSAPSTEETCKLQLATCNQNCFDAILVDVPCSNTGVLRRRIEARWRLGPEQLHRLQQTQLALLRQAGPLLKPNGRLVYSTCSLEPEENERVVDAFLQEHKDFRLARARTLLPFADGVDGSYVGCLVRAPR